MVAKFLRFNERIIRIEEIDYFYFNDEKYFIDLYLKDGQYFQECYISEDALRIRIDEIMHVIN